MSVPSKTTHKPTIKTLQLSVFCSVTSMVIVNYKHLETLNNAGTFTVLTISSVELGVVGSIADGGLRGALKG